LPNGEKEALLERLKNSWKAKATKKKSQNIRPGISRVKRQMLIGEHLCVCI